MAISKSDFEDSNDWAEGISRLDRRLGGDRRGNGIGLMRNIQQRIADRRQKFDEIIQLGPNNWGFPPNTAPATLTPETGHDERSDRRINRADFTEKIDIAKLRPHSEGTYGSLIQITSKCPKIPDQTIIFMRYSRASENEERLFKFKNIKTGEVFVWDGKYSPEGEIILRIRINDCYCYLGKVYLRDLEKPIVY